MADKRSNQRLSQKSASRGSSQEKSSVIRFIPIIILLFVSFSVYFNALSGGFVYDDQGQVVENPWIRDIGNISKIFSGNVWGFEVIRSNYYRPLMNIIYLVNYHLFGLKPWGFHLVNIIFHSGVSVLLFLVTGRLLADSIVPTRPPYFSPAFIAAMLFAADPIHTEAVTWISGLPDVSFAFFYLLSFYLYVKSEGRFSGNYLFSIISFALAALAKEPALTLPIILLGYDYVFREERRTFLNYAKKYIPYLVVGGIYLALRIHALGAFAPQKRLSLNLYESVINAFPFFIRYLQKLIFPLNLTAVYVFRPVGSIIDLRVLLSIIGAVVFVAIAYMALKKNKAAFLGVLLIVVPLMPVLYIPVIGAEYAFAERYLYLPSAGYAILLALFFLFAREKLPRANALITGVFITIAVLYAVGTVNRNRTWKNDFTLWSDTVRKSPDSATAHNNLGAAYASEGMSDMAAAEYQAALRLDPNYAKAHFNLGAVYAFEGMPDMAIAEYEAAVRLKPDYAKAHFYLGSAYASQGQWDRAIAEYQTALRLKPDFHEARRHLNDIVSRQHSRFE